MLHGMFAWCGPLLPATKLSGAPICVAQVIKVRVAQGALKRGCFAPQVRTRVLRNLAGHFRVFVAGVM